MTKNREQPPPELAGVAIQSGVSAMTGKGFCLIAAELTDGTTITGQLDPDEVRTLALGWLGAAEAAEHDAAVAAELTESFGIASELVAGFIVALRERRAGRAT